MPTDLDKDSGFVIDTPEGIAWYALKAGLHRVLLDQGPIGLRPANLALGVGQGFVIVFNTKSSKAYHRWDLDNSSTGKPATPDEIAKGLNLIQIAKLYKLSIYDVSESR